jgi:hypothetical protein
MQKRLINHYWQISKAIVDRISKIRLQSIGFFLSLTISLLFAAFIMVNAIRFIEVNHILIERQMISTPLLITCFTLSLYLALSVSVTVAREYDKGTLELLLYGPVDEMGFLLGNLLAHLNLFMGGLAVGLLWSVFNIWMLNLSFNFTLLLVLIGYILMAVELISLGLLSAVWGGKSRNAVVLLVIILLILGGIQLGDQLITNFVQVSGSVANDPLIFTRNIFSFLNNIVRWISPYSQVQAVNQAVNNQIWGEYALLMSVMVFEALGLFFLATKILEKKGARTIS